MTAAPPVPHSVPDGVNGGHLRYHPIAMNPNPPHPQMPPPDQMVQNHHFRYFRPPQAMHDGHGPQGPPGPPPVPQHNPTSLEQIENRLRQLEHEEMNRMATRSHILAARKREDEEFRRLTEGAEAEEEVCYEQDPCLHHPIFAHFIISSINYIDTDERTRIFEERERGLRENRWD